MQLGDATPRSLVQRLRSTLARHMDVDAVVASFGQVAASRRREAGELIPLRDHARGMILAMLSANRPWRPIAENMERLAGAFGHYKPDFLEAAKPEVLAANVQALRCGNTRIKYQMAAIRPNLAVMRDVDARFGSLDAFVESAPAEEIARKLSRDGSPFRLRELGPALAMEYLKNVGIRAVKPDLHVLRICGPERLGLLSGQEDAATAAQVVRRFAESADVHPVEFDNMIWLLGASEYAEICSAVPRCPMCDLRSSCRYPTAHQRGAS